MQLDTFVDVDCGQNISRTIYHIVSVVYQWNWTPLLMLTEDGMLSALFSSISVFLTVEMDTGVNAD